MGSTEHVTGAGGISAGDAESCLLRLLSSAGTDAVLRRRLEEDPRRALADAGLPVADTVRVTVEPAESDEIAAVLARSTPDHLVLPLPAAGDGHLADEELDQVAGGGPITGIGAALVFPIGAVELILKRLITPDRIGPELKAFAGQVADAWNCRKTG